ncbi:putative enterotoxin [Ophiocordyceps unilateralis]|uniref:Enterotoxin n=1 Tax=Ophiocordyceps unilateralis TaxID=268505 RepID=A0A2A9PNB5_OPHUN|nr:putative enterotoxin [Ophiocordyceps unilateralis]
MMIVLPLWLLSLRSVLAIPTTEKTPEPEKAEALLPFPQPAAGVVFVFFASTYLSPLEIYSRTGYPLPAGYENFDSSFNVSLTAVNAPPPGAFIALWRSPNLALQHVPGARFLYQVHCSENMLDFSEEIWILGGLNVSQIIGHYELPSGDEDYEIPWANLAHLHLHDNAYYNEGWWWGHRMTAFDPRYWNVAEPRMSAKLFMESLTGEARRAIGWTGQFPLPFQSRQPLTPVHTLAPRPHGASAFSDDDYSYTYYLSTDEDGEYPEPPKKKVVASKDLVYSDKEQQAGTSRAAQDLRDSEEAGPSSAGDSRTAPDVAGDSRTAPDVAGVPPAGVVSPSVHQEDYDEYNIFDAADRAALEHLAQAGQMNPARCLTILAELILLMKGSGRQRSELKRRWLPPVAEEALNSTPVPTTADNDHCAKLKKKLKLAREKPELLHQRSEPIHGPLPMPDIYNLSSVYGADFALIRSNFSATTAEELGYLPAPAFDGIRQYKADWSIYNHYHGQTQKHESSAYLAATRDTDRGLNRNRHPDGATFIYVAQMTDNFIPVGTTLRIKQPEEYAVARHVSMRLIHGWMNLTSGHYVRNKAFVSLGFSAMPAPAQPQLAGFPMASKSWTYPAFHRFGRACLFVDTEGSEPSVEATKEALESCTRDTQLGVLERHGQAFLNRLPCVALEQLAMYMEIGGDGTSETVWAIFPHDTVRMFEEARAEARQWRNIDLELAYRKGAVLLAEMGNLGIMCSSENWHDSWTLKSLKLRGKCVHPRPPVEYRDYENMEAEFQNTDGVNRVVWEETLLASRWVNCPGCQVLHPLS